MNADIGDGIEAETERDPRWAQVLARDASVDNEFFYSVATTGVYCRPSCAARRARPGNVRFHATAAEAEAAGYRPCKRCRPDQPPLRERQAAVVTIACRTIEQAEDVPPLAELARAAGLSPFHFHRVFKAMTGVTPAAYAAAWKAARVRDRLSQCETVTDAAYAAGYNSSGRFYARSHQMLGMTPSRYRTGGGGEKIRFAVGECSLGTILVAATEKGVCAILMGDDPAALTRDLQDRFPRARLIGADAAFEDFAAKAVGFVEAPATGLDLPLDVRGTAFQHRVWQELTRIPAGSTASYTEIAKSIGAPKAARAVARACAANPVAVAIPCHRVVRSGGGLSGYRWGVERKSALLEREKSREADR